MESPGMSCPALLATDRLGALALSALAVVVALPNGWLHAAEGTGAAFFSGPAIASAALLAAGVGAARRPVGERDALAHRRRLRSCVHLAGRVGL